MLISCLDDVLVVAFNAVISHVISFAQFRARVTPPPPQLFSLHVHRTPRNSSIATGKWCATAAPKGCEIWYFQAKGALVAHTPCPRRTPSKFTRLVG